MAELVKVKREELLRTAAETVNKYNAVAKETEAYQIGLEVDYRR